MRRIVKYPGQAHPSDVKLSPQWIQWLRHTRTEAPSLTEQSQDIVRQERLKILAAQADQRWNDKASVLDAPGNMRGQPLPAIGIDMAHSKSTQASMIGENGTSSGVTSVVDDTTELESASNEAPQDTPQPTATRENARPKDTVEDPWKKAQGGPSEQWQPQTWTSGKAAARRG